MDGRFGGGILAALELLEEHRQAAAYDWRTRFGCVVGDLHIGEELLLLRELLTDQSSHLTAAVNGWDRPWGDQTELLAALVEITCRVHSKDTPPPVPRPWDRPSVHTTSTPEMSQEQVREILRRMRDGEIALHE